MIIYVHQQGFVTDIHIIDYISITLESINVLSMKQFKGNLTLKIDFEKTFDTLEWSFFLKKY